MVVVAQRRWLAAPAANVLFPDKVWHTVVCF
jgi:hypothetical protein